MVWRACTDDRHVRRVTALGSDSLARSEAIQDRHLAVHEHRVVPRPRDGFDRLAAIADKICRAAQRRQHALDDGLVRGVVVGDQHVQAQRIG